MRIGFKTLAVTALLVAGLGAAPLLYAHDAGESGSSMMSRGSMMRMMGGMMDMMRGKGGMEGCRMMMGGSHTPKPNEQWREKLPAAPKQRG